MKPLLILISIVASQLANADSFTIIRDGKEYLCEQKGPASPIEAQACAQKAYSGPFSLTQATELCAGAINLAPADCGIKAYSGPFSQIEAVQLCTKARTIGPADCALKAYSGPFSQSEALQLCSGNGTVANADCAITAYRGPYSKEQAISLCKQSPQLMLRIMNLADRSPMLAPKAETNKSEMK